MQPVQSSSCLGSPALAFEVLVQIVQDGTGALQPHLVLGMRHGDAVDQVLESGIVGTVVLLVLEIDVVDDLRDRPQRGVGDLKARQQHLERAELSLVRELAVEHVETQLASLVAILARRHELELRLGIDEAPDEPRARHAIDVDAGAGDPGRSARLFQRLRGRDFFLRLARSELLLQFLEQKLAAREPEKEVPAAEALEKPRGATWVTRTGIHVDRMASAWLIRRFIDPKAKFKFVAPREYRHQAGELRFDMFDGEFTHQGELCSFEVLLARFEITDAALRPIAEIIHDIDLKDEKYDRPDNAGFEHLINGIAMAHAEDEVRLQRASAVLDDLYEYFKRKRRGAET